MPQLRRKNLQFRPLSLYVFENLEGQQQDGSGTTVNTPYGPLHGRQEPTDGKRPIPCLNFDRGYQRRRRAAPRAVVPPAQHVERTGPLFVERHVFLQTRAQYFDMMNRL